MITVADVFSAHLHDDGQCFTDDDGLPFEDVAALYGADLEAYREMPDGTLEQVPLRDRFTSDRERFVFRDGSAVVVHGDAWDIEGNEPGRWKSENH